MSFDAVRYAEYAAGQRRRSSVRRKAPAGVLVVACLQFVKGGVLLLTAAMLWMHPESLMGAHDTTAALLSLALHGRSIVLDGARQGGNELTALIAALGLYVVAIGLGLVRMKPWARRSVLVTTGLTLLLYGRSILLPSVVASGPPSLRDVPLLLALDGLLLVYLARGSMAERFTSMR